MFHKLFILTAVLILSACSTANNYKVTPAISGPAYYKIKTPIQCVPHARKVSGIPIRGNAHTWWTQAAGRYERSTSIPKIGSVMVLSKTQRLRYGHVAVVKRIIDSRNIEVEHANWGGTRSERAIIYTRMPVKDVSANNNWSRARFFNYPSKTYGRVYHVSGFIYPNKDTKPVVVAAPKSRVAPYPQSKPIARPVIIRSQSEVRKPSSSAPLPPLKPIY